MVKTLTIPFPFPNYLPIVPFPSPIPSYHSKTSKINIQALQFKLQMKPHNTGMIPLSYVLYYLSKLP